MRGRAEQRHVRGLLSCDPGAAYPPTIGLTRDQGKALLALLAAGTQRELLRPPASGAGATFAMLSLGPRQPGSAASLCSTRGETWS